MLQSSTNIGVVDIANKAKQHIRPTAHLATMPAEEEPYVCTLSKELQKLAADELNEDPNTRDEAVKEVRAWLNQQPHINARTDTLTLLRYLRGCKFDVKRTQAKLEMYYTCKTALPDMFTGRDPLNPSVASILRLGLMVPLPGYDPQGRKVILGRFGAWDPQKHKPEELFRAASMLFDAIFLDDERVSVTGFVQLHDMSGFSFKHASTLTLPLVKKVMTTWTEGYPTRPKAVHYIYTPPAFTPIFNIFRKFMKEKMKKRVMVHGSNITAMQKHIPKYMLPAEYGGVERNMRELTEYWVQRIEFYRDWYLEDEKYKVIEAKKPPSLKKVKEIFGSEQSFKQLDFD